MRVVHVVHSMGVAGAEVLIRGLLRQPGTAQTHAIVTLDSVGVLGEQLQREGYLVACVTRQPGVDFGLPTRLADLLAKLGADVVHAHQYTPYFYAALAARSMARRPALIFTEHGRHYPDHRRPKRVAFNQCAVQWTHAVVAVCGFVKKLLVQNEGIGPDRIDVIYNGVDTARFIANADRSEVKRSLGISPAERVVSCIARFHSVKDHTTLLRAFALARKQEHRARLLLVGSGDGEPQLHALARDLGIESSVTFAGVRNDIPEILAITDVFAMTSLSEGASVTVLEAMAAARPVVVTNVGGNPELVDSDRTGILVPRQDVEGASVAIAGLLGDPSRAERMGQEARARTERMFTQQRMYAAWETIYSDALAARGN